LKIDQKEKKSPLLKKLILGASVDETNFRSDQVSTNASLLHFNSSIYAFIFVFEGAHSPKKSGPACTRVVQGQPTYVLRKKTLCPCTYTTEAKTTRVHPQKLGKKFKMQELTPFYFPWNMMYVHWREREHEDIDALVEEDPAFHCLH
jgi:hypothetical protein